MELTSASGLARGLMRSHGLSGWTFTFDRSLRRFGACFPENRRLQLSRRLTRLNDEETVRGTILHEVAHALAFMRYGRAVAHDRRWRAIAVSIGAEPRRCYGAAVAAPALRYLARCPRGHTTQRARVWPRRRLVSCARCSARFDRRYLLELIPNPAFAAAPR